MNVEAQRDFAIKHFDFYGEVIEKKPYGRGHINDTFCIICEDKNRNEYRYILQKINTNIFKEPEKLMDNICNITEFLRKKIIENNGDPERETLNVIKAKDGLPFYKGKDGDYWRAYKYIYNTTSYDLVENMEDFYESAVSFGNFQRLLSEFPAKDLYEVIPNFHNTVDRFLKFNCAVEKDLLKRAEKVKGEIDFVINRETDCYIICDLLKSGKIPTRVTHNDTKLNNILIDNDTKKGICVIDLDTIMPGTALNDFGDSIRFGASTALEDEKDLTKVECSMELFEAYTKGFLESVGDRLTFKEKELLPMAAKIMTLECGMRFLTDYLEGDTYFKIHRDEHNLDRARTQFKLVSDMELKMDIMKDIVKKYS